MIPTWKEQTLETMNRLRAIRARYPEIEQGRWDTLITQARLLTEAMKIEPKKFWAVFTNTFRILAGFWAKDAPTLDVFDADEIDIPEPKQGRR